MSNQGNRICLPSFRQTFPEISGISSASINVPPNKSYSLDVLATVGERIAQSNHSQGDRITVAKNDKDYMNRPQVGIEGVKQLVPGPGKKIFDSLVRIEDSLGALLKLRLHQLANNQLQAVSAMNHPLSSRNVPLIQPNRRGRDDFDVTVNSLSKELQILRRILTGILQRQQLAVRREVVTGSPTTGAGVKRCTHCELSDTPEWRRGADGTRTLCNACGLFFSKLSRKFGRSQAALLMQKRKETGQIRDRKVPDRLKEIE